MDLASLFVQRLRDNAAIQIEGINIVCRASDGYINGNQLCKAAGDKSKEYREWKRQSKSREFIFELMVSVGIPTDRNLDIMEVTPFLKYEDHGPKNRANWVHPQVAINIAQWISPKFDVKVSKWIHELLVCGNVTYGIERPDCMIMQQQLQQLQNTIYQQNSYIYQQNDYIVQQNSAILYKDDKIDKLEASIRELTLQNREAEKRAEESCKRLEELVKSTHTELVSTRTELVSTHEEVTRTLNLLEDVAERAVPILYDESKMEVVLIYHIKKPEDMMFTNMFTIRGVQESGIKTLEKEMVRKYKKGNFKLVTSYHNTPNAIMLKAKIREWKHIVSSYYSNFMLINGYTMQSFISQVDKLYEDRY